MRKWWFALAVWLGLSQLAYGQLPEYPYTNFIPGAIISSSEANADFAVVGDYALNGAGGGVLTGPLTIDEGITLDGVDLSDFLLSTGYIRAQVVGTAATPAFGNGTDGWFGALRFALSGTERAVLDASGLTVWGNNILNAAGKIPALSSTYFGNVAAQGLQLGEGSFADGGLLARVAQDETVSGTYSFAPGTITSNKPLQLNVTWNSAAITFSGVVTDITNTASDATSKLWNVVVGGTSRFWIDVAGKTHATALKITGGAKADYFLVGDGSGTGTWQPSAAGAPVPTGMLAFFEATCPSGWTIKSGALDPYNGKFVRGGTTFGSGGSDTHTHAVDPPATTTTAESNDHTHTVDVPAGGTNNTGQHTHGVIGETGVAGGSHSHTFTTNGSNATGGDTTNNVGDAGTVQNNTFHTHSGTTDSTNIDHTHSAGTLGTSLSDEERAHTVDYPATATSGASATHTHSVDIGSFTSGSASNVPAYVQVVICRKD